MSDFSFCVMLWHKPRLFIDWLSCNLFYLLLLLFVRDLMCVNSFVFAVFGYCLLEIVGDYFFLVDLVSFISTISYRDIYIYYISI